MSDSEQNYETEHKHFYFNEFDRDLIISKMLVPILRYGKCGFDLKMDIDGFTPILPLIELKRFKEHNVTKDCIIALSIREKGGKFPRFETNSTMSSIRATPKRKTNKLSTRG